MLLFWRYRSYNAYIELMTHSGKAGCNSCITTAYIVICGLVLLFCCAFATKAQAESSVQSGNSAPAINIGQKGSSAQAMNIEQKGSSAQAMNIEQKGSSAPGKTVAPALLRELGFVLPKTKDVHNSAKTATKEPSKTEEIPPAENEQYIDQNEDPFGSDGDNYTDLDAAIDTKVDTVEFEYVERPEDNLLIVGVLVDDLVLDQGFLIYLDDKGDIIIPLGAFVDLLGFPITVQPETGDAEGWFIKESNTFKLARPYTSFNFAGNNVKIAKYEIVENQMDDIYVSKTLIEKWFPVKLNFNFHELRIYLSTTEELPFQSLVKRHSRWKEAKKQSSVSGQEKVDKDVIRLPYKKMSLPTIEFTHNAGTTETAGKRQTSSANSVRVQGDVFGMDMRGDLTYQQSTSGINQIQRSSFTLSKTDFEGNIAGPLKATKIEMGDTSTYSFPLASGNQQGRGLKLTNAPVNFVRSPNEHIIDGFAPAGWDVEVYQDDRLLDFVTVEDDGRYEFEALPLRTGFNLFHIIMYGPNGEKREEFERFYLGRNMVEPGKLIYEVSGLQSSSPLLDLKKKRNEETDPTFSVLGEYGLSKNLSASMGYFRGPFVKEDKLDGISMGVRGSNDIMFGQFNIFRNKGGARSVNIEATGNLSKNTSWGAGHTRHKGYKEDLRPVEKESFLRFSQNLSFEKLPAINYSFDIKRQFLDTGVRQLILTNRVGSNFFGLNLTNRLEYTIRSSTDRELVFGKLTVLKKLPVGTLRSNINYHLHDTAQIESIDIQLQKNFSRKISLNALLNTVLGDDPTASLSAGLDIKLEKYRIGLSSSFSDNGNKRIGLNLSYNFVPQSLEGDYKMSGFSGDLNNGHLIIKPFMDLNEDGMRTENEDLLAGIKFKNMLRGTSVETNKDGTAVLSGLVPNAINKILVEPETLPDIYMTPSIEELRVLGRKGVNGPLYFPIRQLGEVSGIVTSFDPEINEDVPLEEVQIYLLDKNGDVIAEAITEYDGFYSFPSLSMGLYEMFFPTSKALDIHYNGKGTGPRFELSVDEPEIVDGDVVVTRNRIDFKYQISEDSAGSSVDGPTNQPFGKNGGFIGLITDKASPETENKYKK